MKARKLFLGILVLMACENATDSPANSPGLSVSMGRCDQGLAKRALRNGELRFASQDSLGLAFNANLSCGAEYVFTSQLLDEATLSLKAEDVGDSRARCVCNRELAVGLKATAGEDYSSVKFLVFHGDTIALIAP